jgi:hypothetical protein
VHAEAAQDVGVRKFVSLSVSPFDKLPIEGDEWQSIFSLLSKTKMLTRQAASVVFGFPTNIGDRAMIAAMAPAARLLQ